jgi:hypothetical protein
MPDVRVFGEHSPPRKYPARARRVRPAPPASGSGTRARSAEDRRVALSRVLALWPHELAGDSPADRRRVLARLRRALREERSRGRAGHWAYDLARHAALLQVYREEMAALGPQLHDESDDR